MTRAVTRRVSLEGPFTETDLAEIAAAIRRIDDRNPRASFLMLLDKPELATDDGMALMRRMIPPVAGRNTDVTTRTIQPVSNIIATRPWTHVHVTTGETEYFIDVHRANVIEPDEWDFGTNKAMWEAVIEAINRSKPGSHAS